MRTINNLTRRSVWTLAAGALGILLIAVAILGLIGRGDGSSSAGQDAPTHRVDFDVRPVPEPTTATTTTPPSAKLPPPTRREVAAPVSVSIPAVGISSGLIPLGLNPDNTLEVPKDFSVAGWYTGRAVPGEVGPSVLAGHVDSKRGPAAFYRLRDIRPGDTVDVARSDGTIARFRVIAKEQHDKDEFPTARVYGPTDSAELRLITCGGTFDRSIGHYNDNIVVFAELTKIL
jgi:sortase (surface protein transpeptidase)